VATREVRFTSSVAIASLLFGIAGFVLLGAWLVAQDMGLHNSDRPGIVFFCGVAAGLSACIWLVAVFLGASASKRIKASSGKLSGGEFAATGMLLGLLCIVLIATHFYYRAQGGLLPALRRAADKVSITLDKGKTQ
jgi:hypothetical protein